MINETLVGQQFGNRLVLKDSCVSEYWDILGFNLPKNTGKYVLAECVNCGHILPTLKRNLYSAPKRCVFCSNIGNHSNITTATNAWTVYDTYAICNILYKNEIVSTYIDVEDYEVASKYSWRISKKKLKYYVVSGSFKKGTMIYLHQLVFGNDSTKMEIDHIDGNSLNNMKSNLRLVTHQENVDNIRATRIDNQIGIRGIVYNKNRKLYQVDFTYHGKRYYVKSWKTIEEAVWCRYCLEQHFGISAIVNNPLSEKYFNLSIDKKDCIQKYIHEIILRNER